MWHRLWHKTKFVGKALRIRAMQHSLALTLAVLACAFLVVFFWNRIFISVYPGEAAVVWRRFGGGTAEREVYLEGLHVFAPWDRVYRYNIRKQGETFLQNVLCSNGLEISVKAAIRFRLHRHRLPLLHKWYGPSYKQALILPEVRAAIQEIMGQYLPEQIYSLRRSDLETRMLNVAVGRIAPDNVEMLDLTVTEITLPSRIQTAIQGKLVEEQGVQQLEFRLHREKKEAQRKQIEADGIATFNATIRKGLDGETLRWKGIEAAQDLAKSPNSKVIIIGGKDGLPFVLGGVADGK